MSINHGRRVPSCEIRLLRSPTELAASYQLRHEVYDALGYLPLAYPSRLDVDEYDASSVALGAVDVRTGELVGTMRVVAPEPRIGHEDLVWGIVAGAGDQELARRVRSARVRALPSIVSDEIAGDLARYNRGGLPIREMSRCVVRPERRGEGISRALVEVGMACAMQSGRVLLLGSCLTAHVAMYGRYGFRPLRTDPDHFDAVSRSGYVLVCHAPDGVPHPTQGHIAAIGGASRAGLAEHVLEIGGGALARVHLAGFVNAGDLTDPLLRRLAR